MNGIIAYSMYCMDRCVRALFKDSRGATAIEYGLIVALIVLAMLGSLQAFAGSVDVLYDRVKDAVLKVLNG